VRILGLIELVFSYAVSRRLFGEEMTARELTGIVLLLAGVVTIALTHT
jgi:multidrug transporter EmrE-like cation transporter